MLGGPGAIIQVEETMLNYKCKSHRWRSPANKTDAMCIVECRPHISKVWAEVIPDKRATTILPIIADHVLTNSTIYTDEHRSYFALAQVGIIHKSVCHK
jgi:transposase-like protein